MLHEHKITYRLTDEQEARLFSLAARFNRATDGNMDPDGMLHSLLNVYGSCNLINDRMDAMSAALDAIERRRGVEEP